MNGVPTPPPSPFRRGVSSTPWFVVLAATAFGVYMVGLGLYVFPIDPAQVHVPRWVLVVIGVISLLGARVMIDAPRHEDRRTLGILLVLFLIVGNWVWLHRHELPSGPPRPLQHYAWLRIIIPLQLSDRAQGILLLLFWDVPLAIAAFQLLRPRRTPAGDAPGGG
jgi:hypothetical protein